MPSDIREPAYDDLSPMPFGQYSGKPLQDVPAKYLHWLWGKRPLDDKKLENYIWNSIEALKVDFPDGIWT